MADAKPRGAYWGGDEIKRACEVVLEVLEGKGGRNAAARLGAARIILTAPAVAEEPVQPAAQPTPEEVRQAIARLN